MRILLVLTLGMLGLAGDRTSDPAKKELDKFQGEWRFVSVEYDGKDFTHVFKDAKAVVQGNKIKLMFPTATLIRAFKLGLTTTPKCVDFQGLDAKGKPDGNDTEGIWEWKGDALRLCVSIKDGVKERPPDFSAKPNSGRILYVVEKKTE